MHLIGSYREGIFYQAEILKNHSDHYIFSKIYRNQSMLLKKRDKDQSLCLFDKTK